MKIPSIQLSFATHNAMLVLPQKGLLTSRIFPGSPETGRSRLLSKNGRQNKVRISRNTDLVSQNVVRKSFKLLLFFLFVFYVDIKIEASNTTNNI